MEYTRITKSNSLLSFSWANFTQTYDLSLWFAGLLFSPLCHHHGIMVTALRSKASDEALFNSRASSQTNYYICSGNRSFCIKALRSDRSKCAQPGERGQLGVLLQSHTNKWCMVRHYWSTLHVWSLQRWMLSECLCRCASSRGLFTFNNGGCFFSCLI